MILFSVTACSNTASASADTIDIISGISGSVVQFSSEMYFSVILNDPSIFI